MMFGLLTILLVVWCQYKVPIKKFISTEYLIRQLQDQLAGGLEFVKVLQVILYIIMILYFQYIILHFILLLFALVTRYIVGNYRGLCSDINLNDIRSSLDCQKAITELKESSLNALFEG